MKYSPGDGVLLIRGLSSFILAAPAQEAFTLFLEDCDGEIVQSVEPDDLVVVSAPEGGPLEPAFLLFRLVRDHHAPLVVLPRGHPGSRRLRHVVSVAPQVLFSCGIQRGTHPEQHLICSSEELAGITLRGTDGAVELEHVPPGVRVEILGEQGGTGHVSQ
ncbi:MAG: alpha/beta hydrolase [Methanomicrobiales archaeon]|nr:alpha/beta hydrolase [Methanomicrobiales archaeon]